MSRSDPSLPDGHLPPDLLTALATAPPEELSEVLDGLPDAVVLSLLAQVDAAQEAAGSHARPLPRTPLDQLLELEPNFVARPHLTYLSDRLAAAIEDVERGQSRQVMVSMPPRMGKSTLISETLPVHLLRRDPTTKIGLLSSDNSLVTSWGRKVRNMIEEHTSLLGVTIARDAGAAATWETTKGGGVVARSAPGQAVIGKGFKVLIADDMVRDSPDAYNPAARARLWDWWGPNALTRLEPPYLLVVVGTRWHQADFLGQLLAEDSPGSPSDWEVISLAALAEEGDVLGRAPGEPLLSPLVPHETPEQAAARWTSIRESGQTSASWAALYQQRPSPEEGAIFRPAWWRYWTTDPDRADGEQVVLRDFGPGSDLAVTARWVDSWDLAFKGAATSDWVVGQRWATHGPSRYLVHQVRGRWSFTSTLAQMRSFMAAGPGHEHTHEHLVEDAANGPAIVDTLSREISGIKAIKARIGKQERARAVTPEIESGHVYLPHPAMPGYGWVNELLAELLGFPAEAHDDQCLVAGTLVETRERGRIGIEAVTVGEHVLGRSGWVEVLEAGCTGVHEVVECAGLTGTRGHPVWTQRGWVGLADLRPDDTLFMQPPAPAGRPLPLLGRAASVEAGGRHATYNLTTSDGTFYANGVLTHNCDALTQALMYLRSGGRGGVSVPRAASAGPHARGTARRGMAGGIPASQRRAAPDRPRGLGR